MVILHAHDTRVIFRYPVNSYLIALFTLIEFSSAGIALK